MTGPSWPRRGRATTLTLLGLVGAISLSAPTARAGGCHVEERPTLGLTRSLDPSVLLGDPEWQTASILPNALDPVRLVPRPCSEEFPHAPGAAGVLLPAALTPAFEGPRDPRPSRLAAEPPTLHPLHHPEIPDRPPRP